MTITPSISIISRKTILVPFLLLLILVRSFSNATTTLFRNHLEEEVVVLSSSSMKTEDCEDDNNKSVKRRRSLQGATFDFWRGIRVELCNNNVDDIHNGRAILGVCDLSKFPICDEGKEEICYNRKPSRDHFTSDDGTHQPIYYIEYDRVFCYPNNFGGCSSCTPGRYCASEERCILDEVDYPCEEWY